MTGLAEQPISAQENPSGKSNIDKVFNCLNIDGNFYISERYKNYLWHVFCLEEVSSFVNAQQGEQQQPSPRKNRKPKAPKGNFQIPCILL